MTNTEVFLDYDMVVAVAQDTINQQLAHLVKLHTIPSEFVLYRETDDNGNYIYHHYDHWSEVPRDESGKPADACVHGAVYPQVNISATGTSLTFVLSFHSGKAYFWHGLGPRARLREYNMKDWQYGVSITLDLKAVERADIQKKIAVPKLVEDQLYHFVDRMFTVNHLFLDFNSTDLLRFDPAHTNTPTAGDSGMQQFVEFMNFYFKNMRGGNPYILGYTIHPSAGSPIRDNQRVPDSLRPVGTTFNLFYDTALPQSSTLNYILVTKGGHRSILGTPGFFDTNWILPTDQCDAKMIYSHSCFIEALLIKPFFQKFSTDVYQGIHDKIDVTQGNSYDDAKRPLEDKSGYRFTISNVNAGSDQYVNIFTVKFSKSGSTVVLSFSGNIKIFKYIHRNMGFCKAHASATGTVDWTGIINIDVSKDAAGSPMLTTTNSFHIDNHSKDTSQNDCAKGFAWIGTIIGGIMDAMIGFTDGGRLMKIFHGLLDTPAPGIGTVATAFQNISSAVTGMFMLPAGDVYFFRDPACDGSGNLAVTLTYKSEN